MNLKNRQQTQERIYIFIPHALHSDGCNEGDSFLLHGAANSSLHPALDWIAFASLECSHLPHTQPEIAKRIKRNEWNAIASRAYAEKKRNFSFARLLNASYAVVRCDAKCVYAAAESRIHRQKWFSSRFNPLSFGSRDTRIFYFSFFAFASLKQMHFLPIGNRNKTMTVAHSDAAESIIAPTLTKRCLPKRVSDCGWLRFNLLKWMRKSKTKRRNRIWIQMQGTSVGNFMYSLMLASMQCIFVCQLSPSLSQPFSLEAPYAYRCSTNTQGPDGRSVVRFTLTRWVNWNERRKCACMRREERGALVQQEDRRTTGSVHWRGDCVLCALKWWSLILQGQWPSGNRRKNKSQIMCRIKKIKIYKRSE